MDARGQIALVTGAGHRVGRCLALALAEDGADVIVHYGSSREQAEETAAAIRAHGVRTALLQADLADADAAATLIDRCADALGAPTILVNSAAIFDPGTLRDTTRDNWERHQAINLRAPFLISQQFVRQLGDRAGKIVNIGDWRADYPADTHLAYTIAKAGLMSLTKMAALELAPQVQVNAIGLGPVLPLAGETPASLRPVLERNPSKRSASLEEVAATLRYFLRTDFVTGDVIYLDGGFHLKHG